jgi:pyruvate kinase
MKTTRKAKIIATIGPASQDEAVLRHLIEAGVDVARLNFSHGTHAQHAKTIQLLRRLSNELNKPVSILQDLQGPKLRVGKLPGDGIPLAEGQQVILTARLEQADQSPDVIMIPLEVPNLARAVRAGSRILLDDGNLEMEVQDVRDDKVSARVVLGGVLKSNKGVNLPGADLGITAFTDKDRVDLEFGLSQGVDVLAISFVRKAEEIETVREAMQAMAPEKHPLPIVAKLERPEALDNLHEIVHAADGVMVARGDLGVETSPARVPIYQKKIINMANRHSKMVITATQMLESMINNPRPTRAEASDVANAIFDGTDAVMLSGETASGLYPVEAVKMMATIICEAESNAEEFSRSYPELDEPYQDDAYTMTEAARTLAHDRNVAGIAVFTETGRTALLMSKVRPDVPIFAFTPEKTTYQRLNLLWGVMPFLVPFASTVESMIASVEAALLSSTPIKPGQQVVVISGFPVGTARLPNFALLHTLGEGL